MRPERVGMFVLLNLVALGSPVLTEDLKDVHLRMREDELRRIFPAAIPDYEVVSLRLPKVHRRSSQSGTRIRLNAFGKDVNLWLHPTEGTLFDYDTPVYRARSSNSTEAGTDFVRVPDAMRIVGKMLEDEENRATLIVKRNVDGRRYVSGNVGSEGWIVKPLPDRFNDQASSLRHDGPRDWSTNASTFQEYDEPHLHVIYKKNELPEEASYIDDPIEHRVLRNKISRSKRGAVPSIVYPEILVVADYETYNRHDKSVDRLLEYLLPFWNGVDLRYRGLEFPKVRLNIAGIVIAEDPEALAYIARNKLDPETLNVLGALSDFGEFLPRVRSSFPLTSYDVAMTMVPYNMCSSQGDGCRIGTLGIAYLSGACNVQKTGTWMSLGVAVIQDKGAFDGMHTAAHELGHLLGARHDGQGESLCASDTGNIMSSTPLLTENSEDWSRCSLVAFDQFFKSRGPECLFNEPKTSTALDRFLPGSLMTMDEQCEKLEGTEWCKTTKNPCMRLRCIWSEDHEFCTDVGDAAADGSRCGEGKICIHGKCLSEVDVLR